MDHGKTFEIVKEAIDAGYDSVHFDGSGLSFEENIKVTSEVVEFAKEKGVKNIEGELGYLSRWVNYPRCCRNKKKKI